jgi:tetratricopeptide (TPR) repeat protein
MTLLATCLCSASWATPQKAPSPENSNLDASLFYQVLVGEMTQHAGDPGTAYTLMLDAARKSHSQRLYERAVEIALGARSGESALEAAQSWARAFPSSREANRFQFQILLGLNRIADTQEPIRREFAALSGNERIAAISLLPRYFARVTDKKLALSVVEKVLANEASNRTTGSAAWAAIGTMRLHAEDPDGALEAARRGVATDANAEEPALLALALMDPKRPTAEVMVQRFLKGNSSVDVRMAYARALINSHRYADAYAQMQRITQEQPQFPDAWLIRGSLEFQDAKMALAEASLITYLERAPHDADASANASMGRGRVQAYLLLSQIAEHGQRLDEASAFLDKIESPADALRVERRRAAILVQQGRMDEARAAIRNIPELQSTDALAKVNAEVQLLRDNRLYAQAYALLQDATLQFPDDTDLLYDLAMMAERLGKPDEMEQLLRKVIAAKPQYHHAYNALGYSLADRNIRLNEARELVKQALVHAPNDPFIVDSLAWVEFRAGNAQEALQLLQGAFQTRPDAEIAAHLGEVLWSLGQRDEARSIWREGITLNPENDTLRDTMQRLQGQP